MAQKYAMKNEAYTGFILAVFISLKLFYEWQKLFFKIYINFYKKYADELILNNFKEKSLYAI